MLPHLYSRLSHCLSKTSGGSGYFLLLLLLFSPLVCVSGVGLQNWGSSSCGSFGEEEGRGFRHLPARREILDQYWTKYKKGELYAWPVLQRPPNPSLRVRPAQIRDKKGAIEIPWSFSTKQRRDLYPPFLLHPGMNPYYHSSPLPSLNATKAPPPTGKASPPHSSPVPPA